MTYLVYKIGPRAWRVYFRDARESYRIADYKTRKAALLAARLLAGRCGHVVKG